MSWTADDDAAFRSHAARSHREDQRTLAEIVDTLLTHRFNPSVITLANDDSYGVGLPLDGWYTHREQAEDVIAAWQDVLDRVRELVDQELGR